MELCCIFRLSYVITIALSLCEIGLASTGFCIDHGYTPKNGQRNPLANTGYKFFNGSVIRYSCYNNFELQPTVSMQICRSSTNTESTAWSPELPPKCVELPKCKTPTIPHAKFDKDVVYHEFDHLYVTSCDNGYTYVAEESSICLETGQWSYLPTCEENDCPAPPPIEHGSFYPPMYDVNDLGELPPESTIFYTCDMGYKLDPANQQQRICREGHWTGVDPKCILEGCDPPNLSYGDYIPKRGHYKVGDTLTYLCRHVVDMLRTCLPDHTWSGTACPESLITEQMPPDTSSQHLSCMRPWSQNMHQTIKCCTEDTVVDSDTVKYTGSLYCCPERGLVKFVCDAGYTLRDEPSQWICSAIGQWVAMDSDSLDTLTEAPKCYSNTTRTEPNSLSDDMLKPVLGTAAGVLVLLSAAIIIAFCRPKLIDMKRRWREIREDEEELIIDGRRILLPSYEEAVTTSQEPYLQQPPFPSTSTNCENDIAGPSHSRCHRETRTRNDSSSSVQSARERPRPSCSSDEELLVPESSNPQTDSASSSRPQSLILKAGTSVDSCVIINPPPNETTISSVNQTEIHSIPHLSDHATTRGSLSELTTCDDQMLEIREDIEVNLESIYPQTVPASKTQIRPLDTDNGNTLLSYPLVSDDHHSCETQQEFTIHIDTDSIASNREEAVTTRLEERDDTKSITATDKPEDLSKDCHDDDKDPQPVLPTSDHIHIVMSSQGTDRQQQFDEMGSTSV